MNQKAKSNFNIIALIIIIALLLSNVGLYTAYSNMASAALPSKTDSQGPDCSYTYCISTDGSGNFYAKNGITGVIDYSGTVANTVFQSVSSVMKKGGTIFISNGTYTFSAAVTLTYNITLRGEGRGTILKLGTNANSDVLAANGGACSFTIQDLDINGNKGNNPTGQNGISVDQCDGFKIYNVQSYNNKLKGIAVSRSSNSTVTNNIAENNTSDGMVFSSSHDFIISSNIAQNNGAYGIGLITSISTDANPYNMIVSNNIIRGNTGYGVELKGVLNSKISDNIIYGNGQNGIDIGQASAGFYGSKIIVSNNIVKNNVGNGIRIQSSNYTQVTGNMCFDDQTVATQTYGIYENDAHGGGNLIVGNNCFGNSINQITLTTGTQLTTANNIGFTSAGTIVNQTNILAQTSGGSGRCTYTTTVAGTYSVGGYITVTSINATGAVSFTVTFVDETGTTRTGQAMMLNQGGGIASSATVTGFFPVVTQTIRVNATSTISINNAFGAAATYDTGCFIQLLSSAGG